MGRFLGGSHKIFLDEDVIEEKKKECKLYGNCWAISYETDALWRIYSPDCKSLCLCSTVGKLKNALQKANSEINGCIAPIIYDDVCNPILNELFGRQYSDTYGPYLFSCLKRKPFSHEKEIRLLINKPNLSVPTPKFIELDVDFKDFIKEIIFDPRVENWFFEVIKKYLENYGVAYRKYDLYSSSKMDIKISANMQISTREKSHQQFVTYENNVGIYHVVDFSSDDKENDKTLCGQDLHTRKGISIWNLENGLSFFDSLPTGKRLCKNCQRKIST
jgi:hypothetical protein